MNFDLLVASQSPSRWLDRRDCSPGDDRTVTVMTNTSNTPTKPTNPTVAGSTGCPDCDEILASVCPDCGEALYLPEHVLLTIATTEIGSCDFDSILVGGPAVAASCGLTDEVRIGFDPATMRAVLIFTLSTDSDATIASTADVARRVEDRFCAQSEMGIDRIECFSGFADDVLRERWTEAKARAAEVGEQDRFVAAIMPVPHAGNRAERRRAGGSHRSTRRPVPAPQDRDMLPPCRESAAYRDPSIPPASYQPGH